MNPEVKAAWVAALRSGNYRQGKSALYNAKTDAFCCLGVLCELAVEAGVAVREGTAYRSALNAKSAARTATLPFCVGDWAGLSEPNPVIAPGGIENRPVPISAAEANDFLGWDFNRIADAIEEFL